MAKKKQTALLPPLPPGEEYPTDVSSPFHLFYPYEGDTEESIIEALVGFSEKRLETADIPVFSFQRYRQNAEQKVFSNKMDWRSIVGPHRHNYYEINFALRGKCYQYIDGEVVIMHQGDLLIMHPDIYHANYPPRSGFSVNILIDIDFFNRLADEYARISPGNPLASLQAKKAYMLFETKKQPEVAAVVQQIYDRFSYRVLASNSYNEMLIENKVRELFLQLFLGMETNTVTLSGIGVTAYEDRVEHICSYIRNNYTTVTLSAVCAKFGYSERQLHRIMTSHTGASFSAYVGKLRYNRAAYLLTQTGRTVEEIAADINMEKSAFSRFFKKTSGIPPLQYRKKAQAREKEGCRGKGKGARDG